MSSDSEDYELERLVQGRRERMTVLRKRPFTVTVISLSCTAIASFGLAWGFSSLKFHNEDAFPEDFNTGHMETSATDGGPGGFGGGMPALHLDIEETSCRVSMTCNNFTLNLSCQCDRECSARQDCCEDQLAVCGGYQPSIEELSSPSSAPVHTFYMYRSQNRHDYPPLNVNMASISGVMWYLHNEAISTCFSAGSRSGDNPKFIVFGYRRFKITRILRYKVTIKAPEPLWKKGMFFGTRVAFDAGKATGSWYPEKDAQSYDRYGYHVGCNILGQGPFPLCPGSGDGICPVSYPNPVWYSLPGPCPSKDIWSKDSDCMKKEPGGYCDGIPTGQGNCTFTYEEAGEIDIDDLSGITRRFRSHHDFCKRGCLEWTKFGHRRDRGRCGITFWNFWHDRRANERRVRALDAMFKKKYPDLPMDMDMPPPPCDFKREDFYAGL